MLQMKNIKRNNVVCNLCGKLFMFFIILISVMMFGEVNTYARVEGIVECRSRYARAMVIKQNSRFYSVD